MNRIVGAPYMTVLNQCRGAGGRGSFEGTSVSFGRFCTGALLFLRAPSPCLEPFSELLSASWSASTGFGNSIKDRKA